MKTIAYSCPFVPMEWIAAHGMKPRRIVPAREASRLPAAAAMGLCSYAGAFCEEICSGTFDAVIVTTLCDQMRRLAEIISKRTSTPLFLMNVPSTWLHDGPKSLYRYEMERLGRFLQELGGSEPSSGHLLQQMHRSESRRRALCEHRPHMTGSRFMRALADFYQQDSGSELTETCTEVLRGIPLALLGSPITASHYSILEFIEKEGGLVVLDGTDSGERVFPAAFDWSRAGSNPFEELLSAYFGAIPHPFRRPNHQFHQWIGQKCAERGVRGIIVLRATWCDIWHGEVQPLKEAAAIPLLDIDIDSDVALNNRMATRIQAFLETLHG